MTVHKLAISRFLLVSVALMIGMTSATSARAQLRCFDPLTDRGKRDPSEFKDLEAFDTGSKKLPLKASGVKRYQVPSTGQDDINIDFYWVDFTAPAGVDPRDFFTALRQKFADFAAGDGGKYAFGPYENSRKKDDSIRESNRKSWESDNPLGALMSFKLASFYPWAASVGKPSLVEKNGDVQVVCSNGLDFVFATVETKQGGMHPVAGFRGFGLIAEPGASTWTFYSKAIDRDSKSRMNKIFTTFSKTALFCQGATFWVAFFGEVRGYIEKQGLKVVD